MQASLLQSKCCHSRSSGEVRSTFYHLIDWAFMFMGPKCCWILSPLELDNFCINILYKTQRPVSPMPYAHFWSSLAWLVPFIGRKCFRSVHLGWIHKQIDSLISLTITPGNPFNWNVKEWPCSMLCNLGNRVSQQRITWSFLFSQCANLNYSVSVSKDLHRLCEYNDVQVKPLCFPGATELEIQHKSHKQACAWCLTS